MVPPEPAFSCLWRARLLLIIFVVLSLAPTLVHYRVLDQHLVGLRYSWGLGIIPVQFAALRSLAILSVWLSIGILMALVFSFIRPAWTPRLLIASATTAVVFFTAYACYLVLTLGILLGPLNG
jgi:hypothetical protein